MKLRILFIVSSIFSLCLSYSQGTKNLNVFTTEKFDTSFTITVEEKKYDPMMLSDAFKSSLVINGFKVISQRVSKESIEVTNDKKESGTAINQQVSIGKVTNIPSSYLLTFTFENNLYTGPVTNIKGQIIDLTSNGQIIGIFSFSQKKNGKLDPSAITDMIVKALKERKK